MAKVQQNKGSKPGLLRPDTGWAWMVLLGAVLEMVIVMGVMKAGGILLLAYQRRFDASATVASLVSTIQYVVYSIVTPIVMTVGIKLTSCRTLVLVGSVLMSMSYVITSLVGDIRWVMVSNGAIQGLGWACVGPTTLAIIGQYFEKRRGLANSIAASGASAGGLMFAPLMTEMLEWFGFSGCMLILAGVHLNLCISALLYRSIQPGISPSKEGKERSMTEKHSEEETESLFAEKIENRLLNENNDKPSKYEANSIDGESNGDKCNSISRQYSLRENCDDTHDHASFLEADVNDTLSISKANEFAIALVGVKVEGKVQNKDSGAFELHDAHESKALESKVQTKPRLYDKTEEQKIENRVRLALMGFVNFFDFSLFKKPVFVLLQISFAFVATGFRLTTIYLVTHAKDIGIDKRKTATLITIFSAIDLVGRVLVGVVSDLKVVRGSVIIGVCSLVVAVTSLLLQFYTSYWMLIVFCVVLGLVSGSPPALLGPIIVDYMTVRHLPSTLGFTTLTLGLVNALSYYVSGFLRDAYLSYIPTFYFIGGITLIGGGIMCALPMVERMTKTDTKDENE